MNKQRKVVITTTYNELGIIIDTKVEEVAQPNLHPICNQLGTDAISREQAIKIVQNRCKRYTTACVLAVTEIKQLPPIQPEIIHCKDCRKHNKKLGFDENYNLTYKDDACPLIPWRGMSKGHEHDYQSCSFAERRTGWMT